MFATIARARSRDAFEGRYGKKTRGGIGMGALSRLMSAGIRVYLAEHPTVGQAVEALGKGALHEVDPSMAGGGHGHGAHGCGHH